MVEEKCATCRHEEGHANHRIVDNLYHEFEPELCTKCGQREQQTVHMETWPGHAFVSPSQPARAETCPECGRRQPKVHCSSCEQAALTGQDSSLHSSFKVEGARTGRMSAKKPNVSNVPKCQHGATADVDCPDCEREKCAECGMPRGYLVHEEDHAFVPISPEARLEKVRALVTDEVLAREGWDESVRMLYEIKEILDA